jgi:hypothetical protein
VVKYWIRSSKQANNVKEHFSEPEALLAKICVCFGWNLEQKTSLNIHLFINNEVIWLKNRG